MMSPIGSFISLQQQEPFSYTSCILNTLSPPAHCRPIITRVPRRHMQIFMATSSDDLKQQQLVKVGKRQKQTSKRSEVLSPTMQKRSRLTRGIEDTLNELPLKKKSHTSQDTVIATNKTMKIDLDGTTIPPGNPNTVVLPLEENGLTRLTRAIAKVTEDLRNQEQQTGVTPSSSSLLYRRNSRNKSQPTSVTANTSTSSSSATSSTSTDTRSIQPSFSMSSNYNYNYSYNTLSSMKKDTRNNHSNSNKSNPVQEEKTFVSSLTKLTRVLDDQLYNIGPRGLSGDYPPLYGVIQTARDNMISLLNYNQVTTESRLKIQEESIQDTSYFTTSYQIIIVFGKPLVQEQMTLEYATRIKTLVRMFLDEAEEKKKRKEKEEEEDRQQVFKPILICFSGSIGGGGGISSPSSLSSATTGQQQHYISSADAGYFYFRQLCGIHHIDLQNIHFFLDRSSQNDHDIISRIIDHVKHFYLPRWIVTNSHAIDSVSIGTIWDPSVPQSSSSSSSYSSLSTQQPTSPEKKKIMIHFTLLSTDYHLCNINDVHHRSPRQSLFRAIEGIDDDMKSSKVYKREMINQSSRNIIGKLIHTSWSYQYATYPYIYAKEDAVVFLGKIFLLGEELMPLLANMQGVVDQKEFFQRDNYLMLASIRRSLVSLLESLHQNPQLEMALQLEIKMKMERKEKDFKASLEGALLSLGRCVDVVKPAGLLLGSVSITDWAKALRALEHTMTVLRSLCDPDRPLKQSEWFDNLHETDLRDVRIPDIIND